jgi:hypothetical protein
LAILLELLLAHRPDLLDKRFCLDFCSYLSSYVHQ